MKQFKSRTQEILEGDIVSVFGLRTSPGARSEGRNRLGRGVVVEKRQLYFLVYLPRDQITIKFSNTNRRELGRDTSRWVEHITQTEYRDDKRNVTLDEIINYDGWSDMTSDRLEDVLAIILECEQLKATTLQDLDDEEKESEGGT